MFFLPQTQQAFFKVVECVYSMWLGKLGVCTFCPPWCFKEFYLSSGELKTGKSVVMVAIENWRTPDEPSTDLSPKMCNSVCSLNSQTLSTTYPQIPSKLTFVIMDSELLGLTTS